MRHPMLVAICIVGLAHAAEAQTRRRAPTPDRIRLSINAAAQVTSHTLTQDFTVPINVESAPISTSIDPGTAPLFDIGASYRFLSKLALGLSVSTLSRDLDGTLNAKVPHPFFFNMLRPVSGDLSNLQHRETGVHIYAMYFVPISKKLDVGIFGGPSHFSVKQEFATDVDYTASYPFDTAAFTGAPTTTISTGATGYNVGADISWKLSRTVALGGLIRFSGASTTVTVESGNELDAKFGGLQTGAGVRLLF
jgi:hypothetical protein